MYVLIRQDLSFAQQVVQACHAVAEAARSLLPPDQEHPHIVVLSVPDEGSLRKSHRKIQEQGIRCRAFADADLGGQVTAIATEPVFGRTRRHFRRYRLLNPSPARKESCA